MGDFVNIKHMTRAQHEEHGYRRGFDQAIACMIYLMTNGQTFDEIKELKHLISYWRYTPLKKRGDPRLIPPIDMFSSEKNRKILKRKK